jgi:hypothetical protein
MMNKTLMILLIVAISVSPVYSASVFSALGIGSNVQSGGARSIALSGADFAHVDTLYSSMKNPAGWVSFGKTRYMMSTAMIQSTATDASGSDTEQFFNFPSGAIQLPIFKTLGLGLSYTSLTDFKSLYYTDKLWRPSEPYDTVTVYDVSERHQTLGGLSKFGVNFAFKARSWIAVGVGLDYYFGKNERLITSDFEQGSNQRSGIFIRDKFKGNRLTAGAIIHANKDLALSAAIKLPTTLEVSKIREVQGGDSTNTEDLEFDIPLGFDVGAAYTKGRLRSMAHFGMEFWGDAEQTIDKEEYYEFSDSYDISVGFERLPLTGPLDPFTERIAYRVGARMSQSYIKSNHNTINTMGVSLGFGIPMRTHKGSMDIAFTLDFRGDELDNKAKETIIGMQIGITSVQSWFVKRRR